ncbi:hypothetical protein [Geitlerinema sp. P-1104]|nr:hypothetical protein [Geitlerinema sp. P-1104]
MTLFAERSPRYCATQRMQVGQSANAGQVSPWAKSGGERSLAKLWPP